MQALSAYTGNTLMTAELCLIDSEGQIYAQVGGQTQQVYSGIPLDPSHLGKTVLLAIVEGVNLLVVVGMLYTKAIDPIISGDRDGRVVIRAKNLAILADNIVKIDGERIELG